MEGIYYHTTLKIQENFPPKADLADFAEQNMPYRASV